MKVRLIKKQTINKFVDSNKNSKIYFDNWLNKLKYADWSNLNEIKLTYKSADILGKSTRRVVFNIGGNNYRMICSYMFGRNYVHLFINWIGTHDSYTKICDKNLQYSINEY